MLVKPYIKKYGEFSGLVAWIVDGNYIRNNLEINFTNFGQYPQFKFIPKNEIWIDKERSPGEEKFFIDYMLALHRLISRGIKKKEAVELAEKIEKKERAKKELIKKEFGLSKDYPQLIKKIHKKKIISYSKKIKVWVVNGEIVRSFLFIDFTEGGHDKVYSFIPKGEIWIDDDLSLKERKFVLLHEIHERNLMAKGMEYESAHNDSSKIELYCRTHPKETDKKISAEIKKLKSN
ncbi:MAG: hypothetical protein WC494_00430 [Candidatus Pacearchaeota archaeon]